MSHEARGGGGQEGAGLHSQTLKNQFYHHKQLLTIFQSWKNIVFSIEKNSINKSILGCLKSVTTEYKRIIKFKWPHSKIHKRRIKEYRVDATARAK